MIVGLGIDVVQVKRMQRWISNPNMLKKCFSENEIKDITEAGVGANKSAAARFAAKEAFGKAIGCGLSGFSLKDVLVYKDELGKPELKVESKALILLEKSGGNKLFLSLSHEKDYAVAVVIIESAQQ